MTSSGSDITLDLAGYTLTGNGQTSVITVAENTTFTLKDGTGTDKGTITGGFADNGGGVFVSVGASFTMAGATISGNSVSASIGISYGGGVYVDGDARFTMTGGIISGNSAANSVGCGGGVCVGRSYSDSGSVGGRFTMTGGSISGNSAGQYGGGVFLAYSDVGGRFTMDGGTISGNNAGNGGGVCVEGGISTFIMNEGEISGNTARGGGGVRLHFGGNLIMNGGKITRNIGENSSGGVCVDLRSIFIMNDGEISGNTATINDAGGVYVAAPATNVHLFEGTFTMKGGIITGNTAPRNGGGVHNGGIFNMEGGTITGNHAGKVGGGIFNAEQGLTPRFDTTLTFSGSPVVSGNTAGESENGAGDNVVLTRTRQEDSLRGEVPLALITLGELTDGAKIGLSVYDRNLAYPGHYYEYMIPTLTSAVQFTRAETDTSYYADSSQYFFSDNPNYGVRINSDDKYLELAPALTVTFNTQGGDLPLGASDTKTVVYGATYGELPTPTKSNFHFAAWSLSESDKGQHLHVGEDSEVTEKTDHTLYAHWQEKEVPEIDFSIPQTYDYDGKEHPFIFSVVNGPDIDDGLWEIYYFEHTGEFHEKPTDRSEFSTTPPKDVDDYCVVITHPETDQYAYFESEFIHNGIIIKAVDCTLSFETNGGSVIDPHKDKTGNTIDLSEFTTTKEGYSFTGWYRDEALTDKIESITLIGDTTVYAGWEVAPTPAAATGDEDTNSDESSDDGSTLPLTGSALQLGLLLLALCALAAALVTPLVVKRKRKKLDF